MHGEILHPPNFSVFPTLAPSAVNWRWDGVGETFAFPLQGFSEWMWRGRGGTRRFVFIRSSFKSANEITCRSLSKWWSNYEMLLSPIKKEKKKGKTENMPEGTEHRGVTLSPSGQSRVAAAHDAAQNPHLRIIVISYHQGGWSSCFVFWIQKNSRLTEEKYYPVSQTLFAIKYSLWVGFPAMTCR